MVVFALGLLSSVALASCGTGRSNTAVPPSTRSPTTSPSAPTTPTTTTPTRPTPLPVPAALALFGAPAAPDDGSWHPAGRLVGGIPAVYETSLVPPGGTQPVGIAWMDTHLLSALLYSGSKSPGGGPYRYTAPVGPAEATSLVAAFNGGFLMDTAAGGYLTEGRTVVPLVTGAASLVIRTDGTVDIGAWGTDVSLTPDVVSVRQNLTLLVAGGQPTAQATSSNWLAWGNTCGATSCAHSVPSVEQQWRSGVGVTATGALVYVTGPLLTPSQLAQTLARARAVRAMELDINPTWTVLVTYDPGTSSGSRASGGPAAPGNGTRLLAGTVQGPSTFFDPAWDRDFVTMSARP